MNTIVISGLLGVIFMLAGLVFKKAQSLQLLALLAAGAVVAAAILDYTSFTNNTQYFGSMMRTTALGVKLNIIIAVGLFMHMALFHERMYRVGVHKAEYYALIFFSTCGIFILSSFQSMFMLFIGIEIMSIPLYILAGTDKRNLKSNEASLKYFLMGAFSTGFLLMGIAMAYGAGRTFDVSALSQMFVEQPTAMSVMSVAFFVVAFAFKVGAAPFHTWTPDVYDGTPTSVTPFMASLVKVGVVMAFVNVFHSAFGTNIKLWSQIILAIIIVTLIIGNITAVYQQSVKRMLAYSSIAQAGFMLFAVYAIGAISTKGLLIYSASYIFATMGIFGVLICLKDYTYEGFAGLAQKSPALAFSALVSTMSLAGIPLTGGFFAKYYMLVAGMQNGMPIWALIIALLMAAVSVYYYFRVVRAAYFDNAGSNEMLRFQPSSWYKAVLVINSIILILLGIVPALATVL